LQGKKCTFANSLFFLKSLLYKVYVLKKFNITDIKTLRFNPWKKFDVVLSWQDVTSDTIDAQQCVLNSYSNTNQLFPSKSNKTFSVNMIQLLKINLQKKCFLIGVWDYFLFEYSKICFQPPRF